MTVANIDRRDVARGKRSKVAPQFHVTVIPQLREESMLFFQYGFGGLIDLRLREPRRAAVRVPQPVKERTSE